MTWSEMEWPGRELDAQVAQHVMGNQIRLVTVNYHRYGPRQELRCNSRDGGGWWKCPRYSYNDADALWVVRRMKELGFDLELHAYTYGEVEVVFDSGPDRGEAEASKMSEAICLAALRALGQEVG